MRFIRVVLSLIIVVSQVQAGVPAAHAASQNIVIEQVNPGLAAGATQEFIELYNNSLEPVDVTKWCVSYVSSTGGTTTKLSCLNAPDSPTKLWIKAGGYALFVSNEYNAAQPVKADGMFAGGMAAAGGHVRLLDAAGNEVDRLGWGTAVNPEAVAVSAQASGKSFQRKSSGVTYQDTDSNASDFTQVAPALHASSVYEVVTVIDVCPNIAGSQVTLPAGYAIDGDGNCQVDSCLNIAGLQVSVPDHYDSDASGNCTQHDECDNLPDIQTAIPTNMIRASGNDCAWKIEPLQLTEILPNATGSDTGNEFIEIYNPSDKTIDLSLYSVKTGVASDKMYAFPAGASIAPGEYRAFSDSTMKFTLVNTSGRVVLSAIDGSLLGDTGTYDSPADGESWALINGQWQYTNQPTPGAANQASLIADEPASSDATDTGLAPCPEGKYRNPLTNRCRVIETDAAVLSVCDADQYRNPDTGRCRKIATTTLTPCKDGQYRSEETNRCRNIATASVQTPCKDTQYRSEETGRCRNLPASTVPDAAFAV
jgi:hypothetical protein